MAKGEAKEVGGRKKVDEGKEGVGREEVDEVEGMVGEREDQGKEVDEVEGMGGEKEDDGYEGVKHVLVEVVMEVGRRRAVEVASKLVREKGED